MMLCLRAYFIFFTLVLGLSLELFMHQWALAAPAVAKPSRPAARSSYALIGRRMLLARDYLGFRCFVKRVYQAKLEYSAWSEIRNLINVYAPNVGYDLIPFWNSRNQTVKSNIDRTVEAADALMLSKQFDAAFDQYQRVAEFLKKLQNTYQALRTMPETQKMERIREIKAFYPSVLHSMGRALYGAGRFEEALQVYGWIDSNYVFIRQVLFEKMWAAFRSDHADVALGAVASQNSPYFSRFLSPESYLIQTYLYRRLCRTDDLEKVNQEMKKYKAVLEQNSWEEWAKNDLSTRVLLELANAQLGENLDPAIPRLEREREQKLIQQSLVKAFERDRPRLLKDLQTAMAYTRLSGTTGSTRALKPIQKFESRDEFLKMNLEIWPADHAEEWIDEIGTHRFIGESLCTTETAPSS